MGNISDFDPFSAPDLPVAQKREPPAEKKPRYRKEIETFALPAEHETSISTILPFAYEGMSVMPRFFAMTDLARPSNRRHFVLDHKVAGLSEELVVFVTGELFDQSDVTLWLKLLEFLEGTSIKKINANQLLEFRGNSKPSLDDRIKQKAALIRFSKTHLNIKYAGRKKDNHHDADPAFHYAGPLLYLSDHTAEDESGVVYYDDEKGIPLGRVDKFQVTIPHEIANMLKKRGIGTYINLESRNPCAPAHALWISSRLPSIKGFLQKTDGYSISLETLREYCGSRAGPALFESQITEALNYLKSRGEIYRWRMFDFPKKGKGIVMFQQPSTGNNTLSPRRCYSGIFDD